MQFPRLYASTFVVAYNLSVFFIFLLFKIFYILFIYLFWFFKTGFLCVIVLGALELALIDQAGLKLREICLPLPPECWD